MSRRFSKDNIQVTNKDMKKMFSHASLREMQIKTPQRFQPTSLRMALSRKQIIANAGEDVDHRSPTDYWWGCKLVQPGRKALKALKADPHPMTQLYHFRVFIQRSSRRQLYINVHLSTIHNR